jgi:hypothetical protein
MATDPWAPCVHCGEPQRNHLFGFCEGAEQKFMSKTELVNDVGAQLSRLHAERIVAAAIRMRLDQQWSDAGYTEFLTISASPPARHHTLLHPFSAHTHRHVGPDDQGFLTSTGRYVGREEALKIAIASGQPMIDHPSRHASKLFSEDLW